MRSAQKQENPCNQDSIEGDMNNKVRRYALASRHSSDSLSDSIRARAFSLGSHQSFSRPLACDSLRKKLLSVVIALLLAAGPGS